jgi:isoleucyl-tRNA synthetase
VAYKNCICLNLIVDKDGKKMSKSVGNIINPYDVFDTVGADALRWYFLARLAPDAPKRVSVDIVADVASSFINTFWNTYGFFVLYARLDKVECRSRIVLKSIAGRWHFCMKRSRKSPARSIISTPGRRVR